MNVVSYTQVGCAFLAMGILLILQTLVADVAGITGGHVAGGRRRVALDPGDGVSDSRLAALIRVEIVAPRDAGLQ